MTFFRYLAYFLGAVIVAGIIALSVALWVYRDIPPRVLEAKYTNEASRFINIDGVRMHFRDEGEGPVIVLVHANFASLLGWEPWVDALRDSYRVIRFDMTSHGLTGPDPTGDYSLPRTIELTEKFIDAMGLDRFTIGGTSLGGTVAIHYTARHPDRVERLILLSPGSLEGKERKESPRGEVPRAAYLLKYIMPRALPEYMLRTGFGNPDRLSDDLIDRWYDMWRREGQREAQLDRLSQYRAGDIEDVVRQIRVPTLLLWGEANHTADFEQAFEFRELLENTQSLYMVTYPGVGHMAVQEAGAEIARDVRAWLDGDLSDEYLEHDDASG